LNAIIRKDNKKNLKKIADLNHENVTSPSARLARIRNWEAAVPEGEVPALQIQADVETLAPTQRGDADVTILPVININWWLQIPENSTWGKMAFPGEDFGNAPVGWAVRYGDQEWKDFLDQYSRWVAANQLADRVYTDYMERTNPFAKK